MKQSKVKFWVTAAIIAAAYAALTIILAPISYGPVQVRISEALTILPALTPAAIPGLFIGCLAANLMSPVGLPDIVFGSLATLAAAVCTYLLRRWPVLAPLPPVIFNAVIVGWVLYYFYGMQVALFGFEAKASFVLCAIAVGVGELIACCALGYPLLKFLGKHENLFRLGDTNQHQGK